MAAVPAAAAFAAPFRRSSGDSNASATNVDQAVASSRGDGSVAVRWLCLALVFVANALLLVPALRLDLLSLQTRSKLITETRCDGCHWGVDGSDVPTTKTATSVLSLIGRLWASGALLCWLLVSLCAVVLPAVNLVSMTMALFLRSSVSSSRGVSPRADTCVTVAREASKWGFMTAFCVVILMALTTWLGEKHWHAELRGGFHALVAYNCLSALAAFLLPTADDEPQQRLREPTLRERRSLRPTCCLCMSASFLLPAILGLFALSVPLVRIHVEQLQLDRDISVLGILVSLLFNAFYAPAALVVVFVILLPCATMECAVARQHQFFVPLPRVFAFDWLAMLDVFAVAAAALALGGPSFLPAPWFLALGDAPAWLGVEVKLPGFGLLVLCSMRPAFERLMRTSERPERKALLGPRNYPPPSELPASQGDSQGGHLSAAAAAAVTTVV